MADAEAITEAIGRLCSWEDAGELHNTLTRLHVITGAVQGALRQAGEMLEESFLHPRFGEAVHEAASRTGGVADDLEQKLSGGVTQR